MRPRTAVIGASGFIGNYIWNLYREADPACLGTCSRNPRDGMTTFDLRTDPAHLRLAEQGYDSVIIASARPLVGDCENHPEETFAINVTGTLRLAEHCVQTGVRVIFLSSDYVFPGTTGNNTETSEPGPTTEYGKQKLAVEQALAQLTQDALVVRLSKVYGLRKGDGTLLDDLAGALTAGRTVRVAQDQFFSATWVEDVARCLRLVQQRRLTGLIHLCAPEPASRYELAQALTLELGTDASLVQGISLYDLPAMVGRPLNTTMRAERLQREVGCTFLSLGEAVRRTAQNWR